MFYILTCGSTASVWLARALCRHPDIVCFHGFKSIVRIPDPAESQARQFVRDLAHLYRMSHGEQIFGAIHGFGVTEILPEIAAVEGFFAAMMRHPITRLDSLFHRASLYIGTLPPDDIFGPLREPDALPESADYTRLFHDLCANMMTEDTFILERMDRRDIFQYEKIILDPEYFRACFERLAEGCRRAMDKNDAARRSDYSWATFPTAVRLECTQPYLDDVFEMSKVNQKRSGTRSVEEIVSTWPDLFKTIFVRQLERQGGQAAVDRYAKYGYKLPPMLGSKAPAVAATLSIPMMRAPATPAPNGVPPTHDSSIRAIDCDRLRGQLLAIIETERSAHAHRLKNLQDTLQAERDAFTTRIVELETTLQAERDAFTARIMELETTLQAERDAFVARDQRA